MGLNGHIGNLHQIEIFMKRWVLSLMLVLTVFIAKASIADTGKLYNPKANAAKDIAEAVQQAKKQNKLVLIQAGGNWCSWCIRFNKFVHEDAQLDSAVKANYIVYHLNFSPENKNEAIFKNYGYPQRFGFPVFLVLDGAGKLLHTQNSVYLEEGKGYSKKKVLEFFDGWKTDSFNPEHYKN
jgi:thioredoxin-related protein